MEVEISRSSEETSYKHRSLVKAMQKFFRNRFSLGSIPQLDPGVPSFFPTNNLIAYYRMEETSGSTMYDSKGSYNGTMYNVTLDQTGKKNKSHQYNGTNAYTSTSLTVPAATSSDMQSYSGWVYFNGTNDAYVFGSDSYTTGMFHLICCLKADRFIFGESYYGGTSDDGPTTVMQAISTGWHHVVVSKIAAERFDVYLDSVKIVSNTRRRANQASNLRFGMRYSSAYSAGKVDEIAVFSRTLTQSDVDVIYAGGAGSYY